MPPNAILGWEGGKKELINNLKIKIGERGFCPSLVKDYLEPLIFSGGEVIKYSLCLFEKKVV